MVSFRLVKLSSACGIISVPTILARGTATPRLASAITMVTMRWASAARSSVSYTLCTHSRNVSKRRRIPPTTGRPRAPSGGSRQIAESIGSSVKETKSETSTAAATVMPNG